ncbi:MAG TPA: hypothetical protein VGN89_05285 [Phenylobacterium sp.]|nr:hypothetical protein [Phenylobacterium sp.]
MKRLFGALLAAAAIGAVAGPALAHPDDGDENPGYSQYFGGYQNFEGLYQHDLEGIQHSIGDGAYTRREAQYFLSQLRGIRQREAYYRSRDGWLSPWEAQDVKARLERLHEVMHRAHDEGHARQDDWNRGYGYDGYGRAYGGYYQPR